MLVVSLLLTVSCTKITTNKIEGTWTSDYSILTYTHTYEDGYITEDGEVTYTYEIVAGKTIRYREVDSNGSLGEVEEYTIVSISNKEMIIDYGTGERTWTKIK